jgi:hypothetical protein
MENIKSIDTRGIEFSEEKITVTIHRGGAVNVHVIVDYTNGLTKIKSDLPLSEKEKVWIENKYSLEEENGHVIFE